MSQGDCMIRHLRVSDPEMLVEGIRGADLEPCLLDRAPSTNELSRVVFGTSCLDTVRLGSSMLFAGAMPRDCYTLVYVSDCRTPGHSFNFRTVHGAGYMGFFVPGGQIDARTPAGYANSTLTIPVEVFHRLLEQHYPEVSDRVLRSGSPLRVAPEAQETLVGLVAEVGEHIAAGASQCVARVEPLLQEAFLSAFRSGFETGMSSPCQRLDRRCQRLRQARDFIQENLHRPVRLEDLCMATGLSRRGIEQLFQDLLDVTPHTYLRNLRLHGARRALMNAGPGPGVVKRVALDWGFTHFGRFARDYRSLFQHAPSAAVSGLPS